MNEPDFKFAKLMSFIHPQRRNAVESLSQMRAEFAEDLRLLQEQLTIRQKEIEALDFLICSIRGSIEAAEEAGVMPSGEAIESPRAALDAEDTNGVSEPVSGAATVKDIEHCGTQREAAYVIAEINNGDIDLKTAAHVIKAVGLSKGMLNTVVSSLHNFMSHSKDWRYSGPSRFELVARREVAPESASGPDFVDEDSSELGIAQGDLTAAHAYEETAA